LKVILDKNGNIILYILNSVFAKVLWRSVDISVVELKRKKASEKREDPHSKKMAQ